MGNFAAIPEYSVVIQVYRVARISRPGNTQAFFPDQAVLLERIPIDIYNLMEIPAGVILALLISKSTEGENDGGGSTFYGREVNNCG
jgi:hypothetical protein